MHSLERSLASLLLALTPIGVFGANVSVSEYRLDSPVADIQWVGTDKKVRHAHASLIP